MSEKISGNFFLTTIFVQARPTGLERASVTTTQRKEVTRSTEQAQKTGAVSLASALLLFAILVVQIFPAFSSPSWEYKIESPSDEELQTRLEELGDDGWELVTARRATSGGGLLVSYEMVFKRRK